MDNKQRDILFEKSDKFLKNTNQSLLNNGGYGRIEIDWKDWENIARKYGIESKEIQKFIDMSMNNASNHGVFCWYWEEHEKWCFCLKKSAGLHLPAGEQQMLMIQEEYDRKWFKKMFSGDFNGMP